MAIIFAMRRPPTPVPPGPQWYAGYFDDDYWQPNEEWAEWDDVNNKWIPNGEESDSEIDLEPKTETTWAEDYRPTNIRYIVENDPGDLYLEMYSTTDAYLFDGLLDESLEAEFGAVWQYEDVGDIGYTWLYSNEGTPWDAITGIEFLVDTETDWNLYEMVATMYGEEETYLDAGDCKTEQEVDVSGTTDVTAIRLWKQDSADSLFPDSYYTIKVTDGEFYTVAGGWESMWGSTYFSIVNGNATWVGDTLVTVPGLPDSENVWLQAEEIPWSGYRPTKVRFTYTLHYVGGGGP